MSDTNVHGLLWSRAETPAELHGALAALGGEYPLGESGTGRLLRFKPSAEPGVLRVRCREADVTIEYGSRSAAMRGVANALAGRDADESTSFRTLGIMLDCSRNAVMTVPHLKSWMRRLSLFGYNMVMLYTENTYELPGEPYFGYMRGAYSMAEIRELDAYAASLGIEMIACIQTLGHMEQILKWGSYADVMDTEHILLVDEDKTYALVEKMARFWSEALGSRRIHVGMDEAHALGRGRFLDKCGHQSQFDIFNRHLDRVRGIVEKHGLRPMIWSDMYFRMGSPKHDYYDRNAHIPDEVKAKIPSSVDLVYWDYYSTDEQFYAEWIRRHRDLGHEPLVASGIWTWARFWYDHERTVAGAVPCVKACRAEKVQELFFTMWGDGGSYCEFDSALAGLAWAADMAFGGDGADGSVAPVFGRVCGADYRAQLLGGGLQVQPGKDKPEVHACTMLWDDPLLGIGWREYRSLDCWPLVLEKLRTLRAQLDAVDPAPGAGDLLYARTLCTLFIRKIEFRTALVDAYEARNRPELIRLMSEEVPAILGVLSELQRVFRKQWLRRNKPFGMEVVQIRLGAQEVRYRETAQRLRELLDGTTTSIPELDVTMDPRGEPVRFFDWLATGSLRV
jgi:hypothetical protein